MRSISGGLRLGGSLLSDSSVYITNKPLLENCVDGEEFLVKYLEWCREEDRKEHIEG